MSEVVVVAAATGVLTTIAFVGAVTAGVVAFGAAEAAAEARRIVDAKRIDFMGSPYILIGETIQGKFFGRQ